MGWGWAGGGGGCSCKVTEWWGVLRWFGKVSFLVCSVVVTLTAMTLCIVSSIVSLLQLKVAMNTPLNVNKAIKVRHDSNYIHAFVHANNILDCQMDEKSIMRMRESFETTIPIPAMRGGGGGGGLVMGF